MFIFFCVSDSVCSHAGLSFGELTGQGCLTWTLFAFRLRTRMGGFMIGGWQNNILKRATSMFLVSLFNIC
eukprot:m.155675 g.155675  ORF g.155675 m.155675 type:complete len:70 (-) comp24661_c0_seq1:1605-1814(-)